MHPLAAAVGPENLGDQQFARDELVQEPQTVRRPPGLPNRGAQQYLTMRHRVLATLGILEAFPL